MYEKFEKNNFLPQFGIKSDENRNSSHLMVVLAAMSSAR